MQLDPDIVPDLVSSFCLKDSMCTVNPLYPLAKISKFSMLLVTYQGPVARNLSALRSSFERCLCSRGDRGMQPAAVH